MPLEFKLIDGWINHTPRGAEFDESQMPVKLFPGLADRYREGRTTEQLIDEMDASGVERGVVCAGSINKKYEDLTWAVDAVQRHGDRFAGSLMVDPFTGMRGVRELERCVKEYGFRMARIAALVTLIPYNDPRCYPLYAKCAELDIPISINVGVPGPLVPAAEFQYPLVLDKICAHFPELKIIMAHGGDPWTDLCVKLMQKWGNLHWMSSAFTPRRIPKPIMSFLNGRGGERIMWASDYPLLTFERCAGEIEAMDMVDEDRRRMFGRDNALRIIFGES